VFIIDFFAALAVGLLVVFVISIAFGTKGPWGSLVWFLMVVSLFAWVAGVWLKPYGPRWYGVGWVPIVFVGFLIALLLTTVSPRRGSRLSKSLAQKNKVLKEADRKADVDSLWWVLIIFLVFLAVSHYFWYPPFNP